MKEYAFGIDLGGTTAKIGLFKTTGELLEKWEVPTDTSNAGEHILENLAAAVQGKMQEKGLSAAQVEGVGVGVPGPVLNSRIVPIICANLGGWGKRNVSEELGALLGGIKVLVGNDANVAALGEIWMGCAKGCSSAVMVTLGTGVGGGVVLNGKLLTGCNGAAAELGHFVIDMHGKECNCGMRGCFEQYGSVTALICQAREAMAAHKESKLWALAENEEANVNGKVILAAYDAGDETAVQVVNTYVHYLCVGVTSIINIFQPEVLCLGGGISRRSDVLVEPIRAFNAAHGYGRSCPKQPRIMSAELFGDAGIIGAALLGKGK